MRHLDVKMIATEVVAEMTSSMSGTGFLNAVRYLDKPWLKLKPYKK